MVLLLIGKILDPPLSAGFLRNQPDKKSGLSFSVALNVWPFSSTGGMGNVLLGIFSFLFAQVNFPSKLGKV